MHFFSNLKVKYKILFVLSCVVALFVFGLAYILSKISSMDDNVEAMYKINLLSVDYLIEADRDAYQSSIAISQLLNQRLAPGSESDLVADVEDNLQQVAERFLKAEKLWEKTEAAKTEDFQLFHENHAEWKKHTQFILEQLEAGAFERAQIDYFGPYSECFGVMRDSMDHLTGIFLEGAEGKYQQSVSQSGHIKISAIITLFICVLFSSAQGILLTRSIVTPVLSSGLIAEKMSSGDLTVNSSATTKDEFGDMARSFTKMIQAIKDTVINVHRVAEEVSSGAAELEAASCQISSGATEQAASADRVSAAVAQMSSSIHQNAENARQTELIAVKVAQDAKDSSDAVLQAVEAMQKIADRISIIEEIARKTNMLSINASIEAAQAGEHGRGFAVVAAAVGQLAASSQEAAQEISALSIETAEMAGNARNMLSRLVPDIQKTTDLIQSISSVSQEQSQGTEQIHVAMKELDLVIQQNSTAAEETASTAEELSNHLNPLVNESAGHS